MRERFHDTGADLSPAYNQLDGTPEADASNDAKCPAAASKSGPGRCLPSIGGLDG